MGEEGNKYSQIALASKLASKAAPDLYRQIMDHRGNTLVLDASGVEQIGVLCMQILVSASKTWADAGQDFEVIDASEVFLTSAEAVGLDPALMSVEQVAEKTDGP